MRAISRENTQETFRDHLLAALDKAAWRVFGYTNSIKDAGATDRDLPELFKALDIHLDKVAARHDCCLVEEPEPQVPEFYYIQSGHFWLELDKLQGERLMELKKVAEAIRRDFTF